MPQARSDRGENLNSCVSFNSPSKSFNLAGIQVSNIVTSDPVLREKIATVMQRFEHGHLNSFAVDALIAAYSEEGEEWLRQLNAYLHDNFRAMEARLSQELPEMKLCRLEGTYLVWADCRFLTNEGLTTSDIQESLIKNEKVWINSGAMYGDGDYMRINIACPRETLLEGTDRMIAGIKRIQRKSGKAE